MSLKEKNSLEKPSAFRVLAFDPGFERLGAAVVEKQNGKEALVHSECVRTSATLSFHERLGELGAAMERLIATFTPHAVSLEDIYFAKNAKTAIKVAEVRGVLQYIATIHNLPVFEHTPLQVKVAITSYGASDKRAVAYMVKKLLTLPDKKRLDDEIDAIAVGLTCLATHRISV